MSEQTDISRYSFVPESLEASFRRRLRTWIIEFNLHEVAMDKLLSGHNIDEHERNIRQLRKLGYGQIDQAGKRLYLRVNLDHEKVNDDLE